MQRNVMAAKRVHLRAADSGHINAIHSIVGISKDKTEDVKRFAVKAIQVYRLPGKAGHVSHNVLLSTDVQRQGQEIRAGYGGWLEAFFCAVDLKGSGY